MWAKIKLGTASHGCIMIGPTWFPFTPHRVATSSCSLLFRLFCFRAAQFRFRIFPFWLLWLADSAGTSNGFSTKICSVALLRCTVNDTFVSSASQSAYRSLKILVRGSATDFGPDVCPLQETSFLLAAGRLRCFVFFVVNVTPPFSAGWMPTAYSKGSNRFSSGSFYGICTPVQD